MIYTELQIYLFRDRIQISDAKRIGNDSQSKNHLHKKEQMRREKFCPDFKLKTVTWSVPDESFHFNFCSGIFDRTGTDHKMFIGLRIQKLIPEIIHQIAL